ncbi:hypothetical protein CLF_111701 [Clonorchis sinensis]|uniref:Uncharacterized protein n=1 Tax=Clonorchis sinensis TaxID=79923 RepID=G7YLX2_CLOSI|nr:hypothetical protein CLF_111701 [Clonorchis sinensis]
MGMAPARLLTTNLPENDSSKGTQQPYSNKRVRERTKKYWLPSGSPVSQRFGKTEHTFRFFDALFLITFVSISFYLRLKIRTDVKDKVNKISEKSGCQFPTVKLDDEVPILDSNKHTVTVYHTLERIETNRNAAVSFIDGFSELQCKNCLTLWLVRLLRRVAYDVLHQAASCSSRYDIRDITTHVLMRYTGYKTPHLDELMQPEWRNFKLLPPLGAAVKLIRRSGLNIIGESSICANRPGKMRFKFVHRIFLEILVVQFSGPIYNKKRYRHGITLSESQIRMSILTKWLQLPQFCSPMIWEDHRITSRREEAYDKLYDTASRFIKFKHSRNVGKEQVVPYRKKLNYKVVDGKIGGMACDDNKIFQTRPTPSNL